MSDIHPDVKKRKKETTGPSFHTTDLGVWRVLTLDKSMFDFIGEWQFVVSVLPLLRRLFVDLFNLGPFLFACIILVRIWDSMEPVLLLQLSSRLLSVVSFFLLSFFPFRP